MSKWLVLLALFLAIASPAIAQNTLVSATIIDADGTPWASGTYTFTSAAYPTVAIITGTLDATGSFTSITFPTNNATSGVGGRWTARICPLVTAPCFSTIVIIPGGATQSLSSSLSPPSIRIAANSQPPVTAYADAELTGAVQGSRYFNVIDNTEHVCKAIPCSSNWQSVPNTGAASSIYTGDQLFKSGRPWYDVMAFGAKNNNVADDTAAIQAAMAAACASSQPGGIIYFPPGAGYFTAATSTSPFIINCNNLTFRGTAWAFEDTPTLAPSRIYAPNITTSLFSDSGNQQGVTIEYLGLQGNSASSTAVAINLNGAQAMNSIRHNFFDLWGGPAILSASGFGSWIEDNWAQNCLMQRPATVDTGCFDISNNDVQLHNNFVTTSVPTAAGNIGTGHTYAYAIRGTSGFISNNMGEISQHGWLITGNQNTIIGNRAFLIQGNGFTVAGNQNILIGNKALDVSQNANGTFDGFVFTVAETIGGNIVSDNLIDATGSGNGNNMRHGITDNNGAGTSEFNINKYSNNRLRTNVATGVLYNVTGGAPVAIQQPHRPTAFLGDVSVTVQAGLDAETQIFNTVLTANRTVTLSATGAFAGARFRIIRTSSATGAFTLIAGGVTTLFPGQYSDFEFANGQWNVVASGTTDGLFRASTLLPAVAGATDVGSTSLPLGNLWLGTAATNNFKFQPAATAAARTIGIPDPGVASVNLAFCCTATNDNAPAGFLGEYVSSTIATGSSVTLSTGTTANITSISLTAGDWDVTGAVDFTFGATTSYTNLVGSISTTSATIGAQDSKFDFETPAAVPTAGADSVFSLPTVRVSVAGTTTVFLVAQGTFTVSTLKAYGTIRARRIR